MINMKKCKNKKCSKLIPEGYKYRYCESCRGKAVEKFKGLSIALGSLVAGTVIALVTNGKNKNL